MTNQELFKQAIADAKSVRDAAVANAKAALEETFTPKIMSMLSAKLNELEEDMEEEGKKVEEEGKKMEEEGLETAVGYEAGKQKPEIEEESYEEGKSIEETDLEEILAQLEAEEKEGEKVEEAKEKEEEGKMEEAKEEVEEGKEEVEEAKKDEDKKEKVEESLEEAEGDDEITELTVDELKDIIRDVLKDVMGAEEEDGEEEAGEEAGEEGEEAGEEVSVDNEEEIDLDELLAELAKEEEGKKVEEAKEEKVEEKKEESKDKKDLEEAIATIKTLQAELNEVNLLNAKLLYTNKIFKAKSLSESQKVSVLKAFDKAATVNEVKTVYTTLVESISAKKQNIKESVGFASKAVGVAPKQPIVEGDAAIRRMQQLAGII